MIHTYTFANKNIAIDSLYPDIHAYCSGYRSDASPDFTVHTVQSDIDYERTKSGSDDYSDQQLEITAVHRKIAEQMPFFNAILIHGSALSVDGRAYMFTAPSGTGKSTHSKLWRELLGERVITVNDDKPFILIDDDNAVIYGTPFCGKEGLNTNVAAILKAVCILGRSEQNHIHEITAREAYPDILRQTYKPIDRAAFTRTLELLDVMCKLVKFYRLECNMNLDAAELAYNTMKGDI